jgi:hypothetical protein
VTAAPVLDALNRIVNIATPPRFRRTSASRQTIAPHHSHGSGPPSDQSIDHGAGSVPSKSADSASVITYCRPALHTIEMAAAATTFGTESRTTPNTKYAVMPAPISQQIFEARFSFWALVMGGFLLPFITPPLLQ